MKGTSEYLMLVSNTHLVPQTFDLWTYLEIYSRFHITLTAAEVQVGVILYHLHSPVKGETSSRLGFVTSRQCVKKYLAVKIFALFIPTKH